MLIYMQVHWKHYFVSLKFDYQIIPSKKINALIILI